MLGANGTLTAIAQAFGSKDAMNRLHAALTAGLDPDEDVPAPDYFGQMRARIRAQLLEGGGDE